MKKIVSFGCLIFAFSLLQAEKAADYSDILRPVRIHIEGDSMYVIESANKVVKYSIKTHRLLHAIGKKGEGPGEFRRTPYLKVLPESLFFGTYEKFTYYSKTGELVDEKRQRALFRLLPLSDRYARFNQWTKDNIRYISINLLDPEQNLTKELQGHEVVLTRHRGIFYAINQYFGFDTHGDHIYVADSSLGFHITVYNGEGKKVRTIQKERPKIRIDEEFRDRHLQQSMALPRGGGEWRIMAQNYKIEYPRYFPDIRSISVKEGKIFIRTYNQKGDEVEFVILDLEGTTLHEGFFPLFEESSVVDAFPYDFSGGFYYYLRFNEAQNVWELHRQSY
jgi:hypothetical protein